MIVLNRYREEIILGSLESLLAGRQPIRLIGQDGKKISIKIL